MNVLLTPPHKNDITEFFAMNKDLEFQKQFLNLRGQTLSEATDVIEYCIERKRSAEPWDFVFIKLADNLNAQEYYDSKNSTMVGFISVSPAGDTDMFNSGFQTLLTYGVMERFCNFGIMSSALEMRLEVYEKLGYNYLPAYVKGENLRSEKVLRENGFIRVRDDMFGSSFVKRISDSQEKFNHQFIEV